MTIGLIVGIIILMLLIPSIVTFLSRRQMRGWLQELHNFLITQYTNTKTNDTRENKN